MWYLILTIIFFIIFLLEAVIPLSLFLIFIIAQASFDNVKNCAIFAFIAGLLTDIANVRPLGVTAIFFLIISLLIQLYRRKFQEESIGFLVIAAFIATQIYFWIFDRSKIIFIWEGIAGGLLVVLTTALLYAFKPKDK